MGTEKKLDGILKGKFERKKKLFGTCGFIKLEYLNTKLHPN